MKKIFILLFLGAGVSAAAQTPFADCFFDKTMRFDYYHAGDSRSEEYFFDALKEEPYWAGSKVSLVDTTGYGNQFFRIVDRASGREIYSRGRARPRPTACAAPILNRWCSPIPNVRAGSRFLPATAKGVSRSVSARISTPIPILSSGSRPAARRSR